MVSYKFYEVYPKISFGNFSGWKVSHKKDVYSEPVNVLLFGKRVFVDLIKGLNMKPSWVRVKPHPMTMPL